MTFEFNISPWDEVSQGIQDGHLGPCAVYMKKVESAINDQGKILMPSYGLEIATDWSTKQLATDGLKFGTKVSMTKRENGVAPNLLRTMVISL